MNRIETYFSTKIWHPYLILLYFVLKNAVDIHLPFFQWSEPLIVFTSLAIPLALLLFIIKKTPLNYLKINIILTLGLGILFFLLPIFSTLNFLYPSVIDRPRNVLFGSFFILFVFSLFVLLNKKSSYLQLSYYLNILLLTFCVWDMGRGIKEVLMESNEILTTNLSNLSPKCNIYLIVPDGYASTKSLKKYWNFDNRPFDNYLKSKGFFKAENTRSNYKYTVLTMGSCLNMTYFKSRSEPFIESQIKRNKVCDILDNLNYNCHMLDYTGNYYEYDSKNSKVDYKLLLYMQSAAYLICNTLGVQFFRKPYLTNTSAFDEFKAKIDTSKRQFIYLHSMITHPPFYDSRVESFEKKDKILKRILSKMDDDNWRFRNNQWRSVGSAQDDEYLKQVYLSKIKYTNQQIQQTLDSSWNILRNNIVIIMSDHGFRELPGSKQDALSETYSNYCAIYFPDQDYAPLKDSITPINVIRMVMNKAIDCKLPYLPDETNL